MSIDPRAVIAPSAKLAADVEVGPFAIIGENVEIGAGTRVGPHAVINGPTRIGARNRRRGSCVFHAELLQVRVDAGEQELTDRLIALRCGYLDATCL